MPNHCGLVSLNFTPVRRCYGCKCNNNDGGASSQQIAFYTFYIGNKYCVRERKSCVVYLYILLSGPPVVDDI